MKALDYNQARQYSTAQVKMIQRTVEAKVDGDLGPKTTDAIVTWQRAQGLDADGKIGPSTLVAMFRAAQAEQPGLWPIETVGAWTGQASFSRAARDVKFCVDHGINRLDVIVNDHSVWREPRDFDTYSRRRIVGLCQRARAAGIEVHLMSWIMPHAAYIEQAAGQLVPLCEEVGAASLMWDAEEPWTRAQDPLPYDEAARRVADGFAELSCPMGLTGIIFTKFGKLRPLAELCEYLVPQCYATHSEGSPRPETIVSAGVERWRKRLGRGRTLVVGLAAYRQDGIPGHTVESAMTASLDNVRAYELKTVVYWSLRQIQGSPEVTAVVSSIRGAPESV